MTRDEMIESAWDEYFKTIKGHPHGPMPRTAFNAGHGAALEQVEAQTAELTERLRIAVEALKHYADRDKWSSSQDTYKSWNGKNFQDLFRSGDKWYERGNGFEVADIALSQINSTDKQEQRR